MKTNETEKPQIKFFFDPHIHLFNLSHAGLLAYLNRFLKNMHLSYKDLFHVRRMFGMIVQLIVNSFISFKKRKRSKRAKGIRTIIMIYFLLILIYFALLLIPSFCNCIGEGEPEKYFTIILCCLKIVILAVPIIAIVLLFFVKSKKKKSGMIKKAINLLSVMENDIGSSLELLELDVLDSDPKLKNLILDSIDRKKRRKFNLLKLSDKKRFTEEEKNAVTEVIKKYLVEIKGFRLNFSSKDCDTEQIYEKYIMTPLIIDFSYKKYDLADIHYNSPPTKPVVTQTKDVLEGIKSYHKKSKFNIFQIYPFMGINPDNYAWEPGYKDDLEPEPEKGKDEKRCNDEKGEEIEGNSINKMMNKYFAGFNKNDSAYERLSKFKEKAKKYSGNIDFKPKEDNENVEIKNANKSFLYNYFFVGIKVYPPLGFNPWPDDNCDKKQNKLDYIYCYCEKRGIPIVTHCNNGGFEIESKEDIKYLTNPVRWKKVLNKYSDLKLNFAHMGGDEHEDAKEWRETIFTYCIEYKNVYTDFSCMCFTHEDYIRLHNQIEYFLEAHYSKADINKRRDELYEKILYGTDFSINLIYNTDSYREYLIAFLKTKSFSIAEKNQFSQENPMRFLFGN